MSLSIAQLIAQHARRTGADPYTLLATAIVESGLNPRAVGDNGTSYGLYQMHVGGAGGSSHESAKRYLDPLTAIENRARHFRGGAGGRFAASVQRPADPGGYASKVDAVIAELRAGKRPEAAALRGGAAAPASNPGVSASAPAGGAGSARRASAIGLIFGDDPVFNMASQRAVSAQPSRGVQSPVREAEGRGFFARRKGETGQQYLDRLLMKKFGLQHDPGNAQTTGGRHSANSRHYRGLATDFGNARNDPTKLQSAEDWVNANRNKFVGGISELLYGPDVPGHADHLHVATHWSARKGAA